MKILERDLKEKVKIFEGQDVVVKFDDLLQAKFEFSAVHINYNRRTGFLHIEDATNDNDININIVSAYHIELEKHNLQIFLDNDIELQIIKK